jgi:hypothetical protein
LSATLGIGPGELLELDLELFEALERAAARRWTRLDELVAGLLEVYVNVHSSSRRPWRVPRPDDEEPAPVQRLGASAFARQFGPARKAG